MIILLALSGGCSDEHVDVNYEEQIATAYNKINLSLQELTFPKLGIPYSTPGRLMAVDKALKTPLWMISTSQHISSIDPVNTPAYTHIYSILRSFELINEVPVLPEKQLSDSININNILLTNINDIHSDSVKQLLLDITNITYRYKQRHQYGNNSISGDLISHITNIVSSNEPVRDIRWFSHDEYYKVGDRYNINQEATFLLQYLDVITTYINNATIDIVDSVTINTELGRIRIAGKGDDTHIGHFFVIVDTGGNDLYQNVGTQPPFSGFTFVIDHSGNDKIEWSDSTGPGTGIFGVGIWTDIQGDDSYTGRNTGAGVGIYGSGLLIDNSGNDKYEGGSFTQAAGFYGIGILYDNGPGNDNLIADFSSQGYGGSGGVGILINNYGDNTYMCGGSLPDIVQNRVLRHDKPHYISMCQGYSFGRRPDVSGGIGLFIDSFGDDQYFSDIFGQGSSYWFGLGMLLDIRGNDTYKAFEHAQGESLHLGAGLLYDFSGNDTYTAIEHSQGTGIDRAIGMLIDHQGNDNYRAVKESQGAGIKPFGTGILLDSLGNDKYVSEVRSQGYAKPLDKKFPVNQMPVGILLDLDGADEYIMPHAEAVTKNGRIQNKHGIAINNP